MSELEYLSELKAALLRKFCGANPHWQGGLEDFGGREISRFQNMLQEETGGRVSEKWFYTHLKKDHGKLPRVDVLDLLSQFVGFENWAGFQSEARRPQKAFALHNGVKSSRWKIMALAAVGALAFFTLMIVLAGVGFGSEKKYEACFVDALTQRPIERGKVKIELLQNKESPMVFQADENACHVFKIAGEKITLAVQAHYYKPDTITRILRQQKQKETIALKRDDYAWMIHVFSSSKTAGWKKRRDQLGQMIADEAMIFQVGADNGRAMELFNKPEFITKLILPVGSLGELEILQTEYDKAGKIRLMRFCQKN